MKISGLTIALALTSVAFVVGYFTLIQAPYFQVKGVEVSGCNRLKSSEILKIMGIKPGINILELNLKKISQDIKNHAWVDEVMIRRRLPDHLVVKIQEREPYVLINLGTLYYMDKSGIPFKRLDGSDNMDYPVVTGISSDLFYQNSVRSKELIRRIMKIIELIKVNETPFGLDQVSEIHVDHAEKVTLLINRGELTVHLGTSEFMEKFRRLKVIQKDLLEKRRWKRVKLIDLDLGDRVLVS